MVRSIASNPFEQSCQVHYLSSSPHQKSSKEASVNTVCHCTGRLQETGRLLCDRMAMTALYSIALRSLLTARRTLIVHYLDDKHHIRVKTADRQLLSKNSNLLIYRPSITEKCVVSNCLETTVSLPHQLVLLHLYLIQRLLVSIVAVDIHRRVYLYIISIATKEKDTIEAAVEEIMLIVEVVRQHLYQQYQTYQQFRVQDSTKHRHY